MGTTGTIMGVSKYLKEQNPDIVIAGCQPTYNAQIPRYQEMAAIRN